MRHPRRPITASPADVELLLARLDAGDPLAWLRLMAWARSGLHDPVIEAVLWSDDPRAVAVFDDLCRHLGIPTVADLMTALADRLGALLDVDGGGDHGDRDGTEATEAREGRSEKDPASGKTPQKSHEIRGIQRPAPVRAARADGRGGKVARSPHRD